MTTLEPEQRLEVAATLTFLGGFIDSYTYLNFDRAIPLTQTGNVLFLTHDFVEQNWTGAGVKLASLISFIIGIALARWVSHKMQGRFWQPVILSLFALLSLLAYALISLAQPILVLIPLALGLALTTGSFTKVNNQAFNDSFTTGNIKKAVFHWSNYCLSKAPQERSIAGIFTLLALAFISGAVTSAYLQPLLAAETLLIAPLISLLLAAYLAYLKGR
ncbi:hypothetical protein A4G20_04950 [Pasteurellaceae bacterium RH1A]|nr:hypothetical protein A4G20_04950 [Pasteurellaceae bacterium RH1A]